MKEKKILPKRYSKVEEKGLMSNKEESFLKKITDKIITHYKQLDEERDFDKLNKKKERRLRQEVNKVLDSAISSHTAERAIEDGQPFIDFALVHNKLATVSFDLSTSATSKIKIFIVDRNQIRNIQEIEEKGLIILCLEFNEDASMMFTGSFKSGVSLWGYNGSEMKFEFRRNLGFEMYQIRSIFWNEATQVLFVKRRYEDKTYDEIFGYFVKKTEDHFEKVELKKPFMTVETMMDNDSFSPNGEFFYIALPDLEDSKFNYRPFFSTLKPRRKEKEVMVCRFDKLNQLIIPLFRIKTLAGKICFIQDSTHMAYLKESGPVNIIELPKINEELPTDEEVDFSKIALLDEGKSFTFSGITQITIDSFDVNPSTSLVAVTEKNKIIVYEISNNWNCHLLMEYVDSIVLSYPILLTRFSTDDNFVLCRGHSKMIIVDIDGEKKMQKISTLKGVDLSKRQSKIFSRVKMSTDSIKDNDDNTVEQSALNSHIGASILQSGGFEMIKNKVVDNNIGKKFKAQNAVFYYSKCETCVMAIDESLNKLDNQDYKLKICRWTNINIEGSDQTKVESLIYSFDIPPNHLAQVVQVNDSNTCIILSILPKSVIKKKVTVTNIVLLNLSKDGSIFSESKMLLKNNEECNLKYYHAKFLNESRDFFTLDIEFNPKFWRYDPTFDVYHPESVFGERKINYNSAFISDGNEFIATEYRKRVTLWNLESKNGQKIFNEYQTLSLPERTGKVDNIIIRSDLSMIIVKISPPNEEDVFQFGHQINPNTLIRVYLKDHRMNQYSLIQTETLEERFDLKVDSMYEYLALEFNNQTEVWRIKPRSICYESTLPKWNYDQISPSFSRTLHVVHDDISFLYFKLKDLRSGFLDLKKNLKNLYMLQELFKTKSGVISPKGIELFLENYREKGGNQMEKLQILHSKVNLLLLTVFTRNAPLLETALDFIDYVPFFYKGGYDPIDFALVMGHIDSLNELTKFFKIKSNGRTNPIISYLNVQRLANCMETYNQSFREFVIEYFLEEAKLAHDGISPVDSFPLNENGYEIVECWTRFLDQKLVEKISKKSEINFLKKKDPVRVKCLTTSFAINTNLLFNSNTLLLESIENLPNELIVGNIRHILRYLWLKNWPIVASFTFLNWVNYLLFILFILFFDDYKILGILNITFSGFFLIFEILTGLVNWSRWYRDASNYYDLIQYSAMPTLTLLNILGTKDYTPPMFNFIVNMTILIAGYRSLLKLKIFGKVRYMIDMIRQVFSDMIGFSVILAFSILYFTFIGINTVRNSDGLIEGQDSKFDSFLSVLDSYYNVAFGDFSILTKENWSQVVHYMITTVFLALVMFNLMAATIWETFGNFQSKKELVDLRSISKILVDYTHLFSYLGMFTCIRKRDKKGLKFLCLIVPEEEDIGIAEEVRELKREFEEKNQDIMTVCNNIREDIKHLEKGSDQQKEGNMKIEQIQGNLHEVEGKVLEVMRSISSLKDILVNQTQNRAGNLSNK